MTTPVAQPSKAPSSKPIKGRTPLFSTVLAAYYEMDLENLAAAVELRVVGKTAASSKTSVGKPLVLDVTLPEGLGKAKVTVSIYQNADGNHCLKFRYLVHAGPHHLADDSVSVCFPMAGKKTLTTPVVGSPGRGSTSCACSPASQAQQSIVPPGEASIEGCIPVFSSILSECYSFNIEDWSASVQLRVLGETVASGQVEIGKPLVMDVQLPMELGDAQITNSIYQNAEGSHCLKIAYLIHVGPFHLADDSVSICLPL